MVKVLSCLFTEYREKSKFMGNNWNNIETPPGRVAEHLAEIHFSYINVLSYCAQVILWYRKYSVLFKLLVHISMKNITKMHKVCHLL